MLAVVKKELGPGNIFLEDVKEPSVKSGKVKIAIKYAGVCGSDIKIRKGTMETLPPVIIGHEYSGIVVEVGEGVTAIKVGDRVVSETAEVICGRCEYCMSGNYLMCKERLSIGYKVNGAFCSYIVVRQEIVHKIPDEVNLEEAAMTEPAAVAYHAVFDYAKILPTSKVMVIGPGTIGLLVSQVVKSVCPNILLCGTSKDKKRLEVAESLGIRTVILDEIDWVKSVNEFTDGQGVNYVFDCSGAAPAIATGLRSLKKKGTLVQVGLTAPELNINYGLIPMNELTIKGVFGHINSSWYGVLEMMKTKKISLLPLITKTHPIEDWEKAFNDAEDFNHIKVLIKP